MRPFIVPKAAEYFRGEVCNWLQNILNTTFWVSCNPYCACQVECNLSTACMAHLFIFVQINRDSVQSRADCFSTLGVQLGHPWFSKPFSLSICCSTPQRQLWSDGLLLVCHQERSWTLTCKCHLTDFELEGMWNEARYNMANVFTLT